MTHPSLKSLAKRALDVAGASAGLALTAPALGACALAVAVTMGRPVLFRQRRAGLHGEPLDLFKLRTMREPRPGEDRYASDASRITRLGQFLRDTSLDELPTLINVIRGQLSLVGPRPLLMEYLALYTPAQARRHSVRPGVTGLAQVRGRNALTWEEKFRLDVHYIDNWSTALDLRILVETVGTVLRREGARAADRPTMPVFTGTP